MTSGMGSTEPAMVATGLSVAGRGLRAPVWYAQSDADGVTVVVSDWADTAQWVQLRLSRADLERMLRATQEPGNHAGGH